MALPTRVAAVTGAARGIGRAIALRLARDGLDVVVNDLPARRDELDALVREISSVSTPGERKRRAVATVGDVSDESAVQHVVDTVVAELGGLDVMVANAGIGRSRPIIQTSPQDWDLVHAVNVRGVFLCYKAAAIQMIKQGRGGRIIGAASVASKQGGENWATYCASKFAVRGLTQSAAAEWAEHGITVNAYAPGFVDTSLWTDVLASRKDSGLDAAVFPPGLKFIPTDDIAGLVSYLIKDEAKFITGQSMSINAGMFYD